MPCKVQPLLPSIGLELYQLGVQIWAKKIVINILNLLWQFFVLLGKFSLLWRPIIELNHLVTLGPKLTSYFGKWFELTDFVVELGHVDFHLLAMKPVILAQLADGPDQAQLSALREALVYFNRAPTRGAPIHDRPVVDQVRHRSNHLWKGKDMELSNEMLVSAQVVNCHSYECQKYTDSSLQIIPQLGWQLGRYRTHSYKKNLANLI